MLPYGLVWKNLYVMQHTHCSGLSKPSSSAVYCFGYEVNPVGGNLPFCWLGTEAGGQFFSGFAKRGDPNVGVK